ncbi:cytochrome c biogenesis CcdA family protein [Microbacterium sp. No. 7]|uniref:cytochrome c biogenesis CcdA family protein n=1 Tax=Microbacterium sp. No. 7 TaxID=1714373 RepID=UPI0006D08BA0|nr:cytochrome c biogenesis CcdA family protein [Microbacterium sp. No. 7]ALJ19807.1 thiol-disulfide oxidoreductase [Microbacterium sp. No. 7]
MDVGLAGAVVGGILTLLSPCSVMLLPAFFAYAFTGAGRLLARTGVFFLGLLTTLVPLGVLAGSVGAFVSAHRGAVVAVLGALVIALGVVMAAGLRVPGLSRTAASEGTSVASVYLLGTVYGLAGVCAGPLLGAVLALGAFGGDALYGGLVLAAFAVGMTVPLLVLALVWDRVPAVRRWMRPREVRVGRWRNTSTQLVGGILTIAVGVLLIATDGTAGLPSVLGAESQAALEADALRATSGIPDLVLAAAALAVLATVWWAHRRRRTRRERNRGHARN